MVTIPTVVGPYSTLAQEGIFHNLRARVVVICGSHWESVQHASVKPGS